MLMHRFWQSFNSQRHFMLHMQVTGEKLTFDETPRALAVLDLARDAQARAVLTHARHAVAVDCVEVVAVRHATVVHFRVDDVHATRTTKLAVPSLRHNKQNQRTDQ